MHMSMYHFFVLTKIHEKFMKNPRDVSSKTASIYTYTPPFVSKKRGKSRDLAAWKSHQPSTIGSGELPIRPWEQHDRNVLKKPMYHKFVCKVYYFIIISYI